MPKDEGALRTTAEDAQAKLDDLRDKYAKKPTDATGAQLAKARKDASKAWAALWAAAPGEKPPTQRVM
jgi:hypothetical protein